MRFLWIIVIMLAGSASGYLYTRFEGTPPFIQMRTSEAWIGAGEHRQEIRVSDDGTGIQLLRVWLESGEETYDLIDQTFDGNLFTGANLRLERKIDVTIDPGALGLADGPATLRVEARDFSWRGNVSTAALQLNVDTRPPRISLETGLTYVRRGGAELVVYRVDDDTKRHGVQVGETLFPGFVLPADDRRRVAFYAIPPDASSDIRPVLFARDAAGNRSEIQVPISLIERSFRHDRVALSEAFMRRKLVELGVSEDDGVIAGYLKINRDMRARNGEEIREVCSGSSDDQLWTGPFLQLPGSQRKASFAERRTYSYRGEQVDEQVHMGLDIASTAHALVLAANDGVVVFADELGIYGNTVIVDHGLGIFSLYGHLSEIGVSKGDALVRSDELGRTGTTGLAGGDHLHFAMLVNGVFVDPIEWFDARWLREHIEPKLAAPIPADPADS